MGQLILSGFAVLGTVVSVSGFMWPAKRGHTNPPESLLDASAIASRLVLVRPAQTE